MGKLRDDSKLYEELSNKYDERENEDIHFEFFDGCVDTALRYSKREMRFVIFKLKSLYDDVDTGLEKANLITKVVKFLAGDSFKASFIITVLEVALDEK